MLKKLLHTILAKNEKKLGVSLNYARKIADTDIGLFMRYGKIFNFLDPRKHTTTEAYHTARLSAAIIADCGTCVEAEINLAKNAGLTDDFIDNIIENNDSLPIELSSIIALSSSVVTFQDNPEARNNVIEQFGEKGLIELSYAISGAVLLPSIKRSMGYATSCNLHEIRKKERH